jgi:type I restriction enzyme S subunit
MREPWKRCRLGDAITLRRGYDLPQRRRLAGPHPVVSSAGITDFHSAYKVQGPGVVTGRYGTLGEVFYVEGDFWPLNTSLYVEDFKGNDPRFISYLLRTLNFSSQNAAGAVPGVNRNHLHSLEVSLPPVEQQQQIAALLAPYDELIENCGRRLAVLEELVRGLYREWFIRFRYPGHKGERSQPLRAGRVPKGWRSTPLKTLTTKIGSGATPRGGKSAYKESGVALIRSMNVYDYRFEYADLALIDAEQAGLLDHVAVEAGDVLLNITGASVARCALAPSHLLPARVNQHVAILRPHPEKTNPSFLLDTLNAEGNKSRLLALAQGGATREALTKAALSRFSVLRPPLELQEQYHRIAGPIHQERELLQCRIQNLQHTRDLLLPRLLSGQIGLEG